MDLRLASPTSGAAGAASAGDRSEIAVMAPLCAVFRRFLKTRNLKYTPERADILDAIIERDGVFEVEELMMEMRRRGYRVSKATAYRTIKLLQDAGIITQALFDARQSHYQLIYGKAPRDYIVCMKSGRHQEFSSPELMALRDRICRQHGWEPVGHRFVIYAVSPEGLVDPPNTQAPPSSRPASREMR
jgi:Fur family ferric uptake transcriptional regulator